MDDVIDLAAWKRLRAVQKGAHPAGTGGSDAERGAARLERAVERLHALISKAVDGEGKLEGAVETELLAIMGQLTVGSVGNAASRAERLADRLASKRKVSRS
jgi:hypothetical protein